MHQRWAEGRRCGPGLPAEIKTVAEYIAWARANPKHAVYGIPAAGSALHFAGMMLQRAAKFDFNSVPYRGGAPALLDLMAGRNRGKMLVRLG